MKSTTQSQFTVQRKNVWQLFILYGCVLFYVVFLTPNRYRGDDSARINLIPLINTISEFSEQGNEHFWPYYIGYWGNIFGNIILLVPFGFLFKCLSPKKNSLVIFGYGLLLSVSIEVTQLVFRIGVCDIDDVILNVLGVAMGTRLYQMVKNRKPEWFAELL